MIAFFALFLYMTNYQTMGYQRLSGNTNHNNVDQKPTHLPPGHYTHGHRWNEPYFDVTMPKNITSLVGKSAYLGCRVKHLGNKTVAWIRTRDLHILTVGTYTYTTDQRFQTSYHRDIDEWTLQIKWAQQRDAGVYECQISTQPVRSFSVNLNIVVPTATILGGPDLYVDKGSTINLTCVIKFSTEPPTHIFWYHQDKVLSEETSGGRLKFKTIKAEETKSILLIDDAALTDSGKYSCYPSNTEIASIRVHVLQGERPEAMQTNAAVATKVKISNPFTVLTTFVATLALWYTVAMFLKNLRYYNNANITITIKATANSKIQSGNHFYNNNSNNNNSSSSRSSNINNNNNKQEKKKKNNKNSNSISGSISVNSNKYNHNNINSKRGNCITTDDDDDKDVDNGNKADFQTNKIEEDRNSFKEICNVNNSNSNSNSTICNYCEKHQHYHHHQQQYHHQKQQPKHQHQHQQQHNNAVDYKLFNVILVKWNQRHALR